MPPEESPEAKFDRVKRRLQDLVLRGYPNPERKGCPGDAVLRELAERPLDEAVEGDSHWHHVTHCSECYREFLGFNNAFRERAKVHVARGGWTVAVAAIVIVAGVLIGLNHPSGFLQRSRSQNAEPTWVDDTVVVPSQTRSGSASEQKQQKPIFLRRLPLRLTVQLPFGSEAGAYELQLKMDDQTVVSTGGEAGINNGTTAFIVKVNLSEIEPGSYSMMIRQVPNSWRLYPVVIR